MQEVAALSFEEGRQLGEEEEEDTPIVVGLMLTVHV
jgi:hypothetical protein